MQSDNGEGAVGEPARSEPVALSTDVGGYYMRLVRWEVQEVATQVENGRESDVSRTRLCIADKLKISDAQHLRKAEP